MPVARIGPNDLTPILCQRCSRARTRCHPAKPSNSHCREDTPVAIWGWPRPEQAVGIQRGTSNYCPVHQEQPPPNLTWPHQHLNAGEREEVSAGRIIICPWQKYLPVVCLSSCVNYDFARILMWFLVPKALSAIGTLISSFASHVGPKFWTMTMVGFFWLL